VQVPGKNVLCNLLPGVITAQKRHELHSLACAEWLEIATMIHVQLHSMLSAMCSRGSRAAIKTHKRERHLPQASAIGR
jgi:hypothetical protein